jgi:hypothetical protein
MPSRLDDAGAAHRCVLESGRSPRAGATKTLRHPNPWSWLDGDRAALAFANGRPRPKASVCFR